MSGNIIVGIPTRNQFEFVLNELLPSLTAGTVVPDVVVFWDNSDGNQLPQYINNGGGEALAKATAAKVNPKPIKFLIQGIGRNLALSDAWNTIIHKCADDDHIILANDDIIFLPDTIEKLVAANKEFNYPAGARAGNSFSLFKIDRKMWSHVGPFDGNFWPAYFEDNDMHYRMKLLGYDIHPIMDAEYIHVGSATQKSFTPEERAVFHDYFRINQTYYLFKWGGLPGKETYTVAFNGRDPQEAIAAFNARYRS